MKVLKAKYKFIYFLLIWVSSVNVFAAMKSEYQAGIYAAQSGNIILAKRFFLTAHKKSPGNNAVKLSLKVISKALKHTINRKAVDNLFKGLYSSSIGQYPAAIRHYSRALDIDPKLALAYKERGDTYMKSIDIKNLKISPRRAVKFFAERANSFNRWAIRDFDQAIKLVPSYYEAYISKGKAYGDLAISTKYYSMGHQDLISKEKACYKKAALIRSKL